MNSEQTEAQEDALLLELKAIASGDANFIGTLQVVEIAFTGIPSL